MSSILRQEVELTVRSARNYYRWLLQEIDRNCGDVVLEIGAGTGEIAEGLLKEGRKLILNEMDELLYIQLKSRFNNNSNVKIIKGDINVMKRDIFKITGSSGKDEKVDTVLMINVLEHIKDDVLILRKAKEILGNSGRLILYVPAHRWLYGEYDRVLGHYRRYSKKLLKNILEGGGFKVKILKGMHFTGVFGWLMYRLTGVRRHNEAMVRLYDRLVIPVSRFIEERLGIRWGLSYFCVAEV
jgi:SAM-dependent methyltransferase